MLLILTAMFACGPCPTGQVLCEDQCVPQSITTAEITEDVFSKSCAFSSCHSSAASASAAATSEPGPASKREPEATPPAKERQARAASTPKNRITDDSVQERLHTHLAKVSHLSEEVASSGDADARAVQLQVERRSWWRKSWIKCPRRQ